MKTNRKIAALSIVMILFLIPAVFAQTFEEYFDQGNKLYEEGRYNDAIKIYQKAVELNSNFAPLYNALGLAYDKVSDNLSQIAWYYKTAIDMEPDYIEAYYNLGQVYYRFEKFGKAEKNFLKALSFNPNLLMARYTLAWSYLRNKQPADAVRYFKDVISASDKVPQAYYGLGLAYAESGDSPGVLEAVTALRGMGEDDLAAQLEAGIRKPIEIKPLEPAAYPLPLPTGSSTTVRTSAPPAPTPSTNAGGSVGGSTRVRLRGKMFGGQEGSPTATAPSKQYGVNPPAGTPPKRPTGSRTYRSLPSY